MNQDHTQSFLTRFGKKHNKNQSGITQGADKNLSTTNMMNSLNQEIQPFTIDYGNKILWEDSNNKRGGAGTAPKSYNSKSPKKPQKPAKDRENHTSNN